MPVRCVVYGCGNINDKGSKEKGISLHHIPFWEDESQKPNAGERDGLTLFNENVRISFRRSTLLSVPIISEKRIS